MIKHKLLLLCGLLSIVQPVFADGDDYDTSSDAQQQLNSWDNPQVGFDSCWENGFFQRELDSMRNLESRFLVQLAEIGHVPYIGSLPNKGGKSIAILRNWLISRQKQLAGKASPGNADHAQHLAEMQALRRKLNRYVWRYTGAGRFAGDHKKMLTCAALALAATCVTVWYSQRSQKQKPSLWQQLLQSLSLQQSSSS